MDCKTARLLLHFARPLSAELDTDEAEALAGHIADCPECQQLRQTEQQVDARIGQAMRAVPTPIGLRERLLANLDGQRRTGERRRFVRLSLALAASVLLAGGWWYWSQSLTRLDLERLDPDLIGFIPESAEQVQEAFQQRGIAVQVPGEFNYALLSNFDTTQRWGRRMPYVHLQRGAAFVRIYILERGQFNLDYLEQHPEAPSSRVTLKWWGRSPDGRFGYLVEYTGPSLEPFKNSRVLPAT
jgi:Protein of unknown function (DUF3379)